MFPRYTTRAKNGKEHRYYSLVENRRVASGRVIQRQALYLGEINTTQQEAWRKTVERAKAGDHLRSFSRMRSVSTHLAWISTMLRNVLGGNVSEG